MQQMDIKDTKKDKEVIQIGMQFEGKNGIIDYNPLRNNKITCLYFAASFSPPCQAFTPLLIDFCNEVNSEDKVLEIILIPLDNSKQEFKDFFELMPWLAIPYEESQRIDKFKKHFKVEGIPKLIVLKQNGEVNTTQGRQDVTNEGIEAFSKWLKNIPQDM